MQIPVSPLTKSIVVDLHKDCSHGTKHRSWKPQILYLARKEFMHASIRKKKKTEIEKEEFRFMKVIERERTHW